MHTTTQSIFVLQEQPRTPPQLQHTRIPESQIQSKIVYFVGEQHLQRLVEFRVDRFSVRWSHGAPKHVLVEVASEIGPNMLAIIHGFPNDPANELEER